MVIHSFDDLSENLQINKVNEKVTVNLVKPICHMI